MTSVSQNIQAYSKSCAFCRADIMTHVFMESADFLAIYNVAPIVPGHSLIVPRQHVTSFLDLTDSQLFDYVQFGRRVIRLLLATFGVQEFNWTIQEGRAAGQTIEHLHMHVIPRKPGDLPQPGDWYRLLFSTNTEPIDSDSRPRLTDAQLSKIVDTLRQNTAKLNTSF